MEMQSGVVYQIGYQDCPATYVGQTGRTLTQRLKEHKSTLTNAHPDKSAAAEHAIDTGHTIDWGNIQVKAVTPLFWQRCTLETWHMRSQPHPSTGRKASYPMCTMHSWTTPHACTGRHYPVKIYFKGHMTLV